MERLAKRLEIMASSHGLTKRDMYEKFDLFLKTKLGVETNPAKLKGWSTGKEATTSEVADETAPEGEGQPETAPEGEGQPENPSDDVEKKTKKKKTKKRS